MNIAYSHKFRDPQAKHEAVRQNTRYMMYLFWWDNVPNYVRENPDMQDYTKDMILEFEEKNKAIYTTTYMERMSDFLSRLAEDAVEHFKEIREL